MMRDWRRPAHCSPFILGKDLLPGLQGRRAELGVTVPDNRKATMPDPIARRGCLFNGAEEYLGAARIGFTAANRTHDTAHKIIRVQEIPDGRGLREIKLKLGQRIGGLLITLPTRGSVSRFATRHHQYPLIRFPYPAPRQSLPILHRLCCGC